jgi:hypothetical protein
MRLLNFIKEEYESRVTSMFNKVRSATVYKNPTASDIKQLNIECKDHIFGSSGLQVRFVIDTRSFELYIWDAYNILHNDFLLNRGSISNIVYAGMGFLKGNKIDIESGDVWERTTDGGPNPTYHLENRWKDKRDKLRKLDKYFTYPLVQMLDMYYDRKTGLEEDYVAVLPASYRPREVSTLFKNPSTKELKESCNNPQQSCRFMIDVHSKDFYVWDWKTMHEDVSLYLSKNKVYNIYPCFRGDFLWGQARFDEGKLELLSVSCGLLYKEDYNKLISKIKFITKWFNDSLIKKLESKSEVLSEEYVTRVGIRGTEVFKNPSKKEMASATLEGSIRFVIDVNKEDVYVWNYNTVHTVIARHFGFDYPCKKGNAYLYGAASVEHGNIQWLQFFDIFDTSKEGKANLKDLKWTKKYFGDVLTTYIEKWYKISF